MFLSVSSDSRLCQPDQHFNSGQASQAGCAPRAAGSQVEGRKVTVEGNLRKTLLPAGQPRAGSCCQDEDAAGSLSD